MDERIKRIFELIEEKEIEFVDLRFTDFPGSWQHFTLPASRFAEDSFSDGIGFDGSSIRGWKSINESDMVVLPDPDTAFVDPFYKRPTLNIIADVNDPVSGRPYSRDPRFVAKKAEEYLKSTGIADTAYFGPEAEFFLLDDVRFSQDEKSASYSVDSIEGFWNSGKAENPNLSYKARFKGGYFPVPPTDSLHDLRSEIVSKLVDCGVSPEVQHHEVATAGQSEIDLRFAPLVKMADALSIFKYVVKNTAWAFGKTATFMPKPIFGDNGSGMHVHVSLWKEGRNLFSGPEYAGLSEIALYFIGGILRHAPALLAFTNASTNSYKRLVPGFEAPVNLAYSRRNRSAAVRIPMYSEKEAARRIEFRCPDATGNGYFTMAAILMAGLDGIDNRIDPGEPLDKNIYDMPPEELKQVAQTPPDFTSALKELENDFDFLIKGDVFTEDIVRTWIDYKIENEIIPLQIRPHPYEFALYYDV